MFWGKIMGETNDYLVAYALTPAFGFPTKKFFFCTTGVLSVWHISTCKAISCQCLQL